MPVIFGVTDDNHFITDQGRQGLGLDLCGICMVLFLWALATWNIFILQNTVEEEGFYFIFFSVAVCYTFRYKFLLIITPLYVNLYFSQHWKKNTQMFFPPITPLFRLLFFSLSSLLPKKPNCYWLTFLAAIGFKW